MKQRVTAVIAVMMCLVAAGCTDNDEPDRVDPSTSIGPQMTFEEAYQKVPMDGAGDLKISWDVPPAVDVDEVAAARRNIAYDYWMHQATDWTSIIPLGRFLYTEWWYQQVLAKAEAGPISGDRYIGPIWVKFMGVEKLGPDKARVTFCTDIGWWHQTSWDRTKARKDRATLESLIMENVLTGDGERRWLANQHFNPDGGDRRAKYGVECTKWAQHKP